jgi:uncharacterized oligopeptide transporter (OPT) family protein
MAMKGYAMTNPFGPLYQAPHATAGQVVASGADPAASQWLMIIGAVIIVATAVWTCAALALGAWIAFRELRDRRGQAPAGDWGGPSPS